MFLSEWREFPSAPCLEGGKRNLMTARVSMLLKSRASLTYHRACFLPGRAKDLSAPPYYDNILRGSEETSKFNEDGNRTVCLLKNRAHMERPTGTTQYDTAHRDVTRHRLPNEQDGRTSACKTEVYLSTVHGYRTWFFCWVLYTTNPRGQRGLLCKEKPTKVIFVSV